MQYPFATKSSLVVAAATLTLFSLSTALHAEDDAAEKALMKKAKISEDEARKIALTKAPDGKAKWVEIEEEKGLLIWSCDVVRPGTKDITEVQVDAMTGKIVSVEIEDQAAQAKEYQEWKSKEHKHGEEADDKDEADEKDEKDEK